MKTYYYTHLTDDLVDSHNQNFALSENYTILPSKPLQKAWNIIARTLASGFGWIYSKLFLHVHVEGKNKLKTVKNTGYFVYGNHTQPMGDVFTPLTIFSPYNFYAIANQANWGIPIIGKFLVRYGGLPVGKNIKQSIKLIKAIQQVINNKGIVMIYPEAHVWPYYTKIRPFDATSFHFPIKSNAPSFVMTTTYHKPRFGKFPKIITYIDGPFYPDQALSSKKAQEKLYNEVRTMMQFRAKTSNYNYCQYISKNKEA
ncbi:lysophospholipid acyltransferase family protein [Lactobacillus sp. LL6]|uniref:lysophospholipid acyltransferase family protein n=1 Tax=Lactobacillus sp. LL6 TaxID=2596827 RepID=UPI0011847FFB|nr:lysophospholipid acyltransferase family protein [Lactobacillus sp. LL6]TSO25594.1 1-acyl-sn-glycerol-3-phosphate acyltransferase [Lactobacillus sp. LL6]